MLFSCNSCLIQPAYTPSKYIIPVFGSNGQKKFAEQEFFSGGDMKIFIGMILIFTVSCLFAEDRLELDKKIDLKNINETLSRARKRIKASPDIRGADLLKLLPSFSVGQKGSSNDFLLNESYLSATINTNQIFDVVDRARNNESLKRKALQKIREEGFILKKLSERKYLLKKQIWKFSQIRSSTDSPVEHASIDEKIDNLTVKLQETEIEMEKSYTAVEFVCIEAEK
jgi:hypothetical protein